MFTSSRVLSRQIIACLFRLALSTIKQLSHIHRSNCWIVRLSVAHGETLEKGFSILLALHSVKHHYTQKYFMAHPHFSWVNVEQFSLLQLSVLQLTHHLPSILDRSFCSRGPEHTADLPSHLQQSRRIWDLGTKGFSQMWKWESTQLCAV